MNRCLLSAVDGGNTPLMKKICIQHTHTHTQVGTNTCRFSSAFAALVLINPMTWEVFCRIWNRIPSPTRLFMNRITLRPDDGMTWHLHLALRLRALLLCESRDGVRVRSTRKCKQENTQVITYSNKDKKTALNTT